MTSLKGQLETRLEAVGACVVHDPSSSRGRSHLEPGDLVVVRGNVHSRNDRGEPIRIETNFWSYNLTRPCNSMLTVDFIRGPVLLVYRGIRRHCITSSYDNKSVRGSILDFVTLHGEPVYPEHVEERIKSESNDANGATRTFIVSKHMDEFEYRPNIVIKKI